MAACYMAQGKFDDAEGVLQEAMDKVPENPLFQCPINVLCHFATVKLPFDVLYVNT